MRSGGAEDTGLLFCGGCAEVEEGLLLCEGCCDREEDCDIGGGGSIEDGGKRGKVGNFGRGLFEEEVEVAMGVDEGRV